MASPADRIEDILVELRRVLVGQTRMQERLLVCLLARGHCLLESVPGLAKTLAAESLATIIGGQFKRVQFTPDLLPSDIVGTRIYRPSREEFDIELGPVFANVLLTDEINRAPAKVQSALLEVMGERHVTIGGTRFDVPDPFFVIATQNPIESEGVYELPDAQRDRFMMKVVMTHPERSEELEIIERVSVAIPTPRTVIGPEHVRALQRAADVVFVDATVKAYAVDLVMATRSPGAFGMADIQDVITLGASPRASLGLVRGARVLAMMRGRNHATAQDVFDIAPEILRHRLILSYEALARELSTDHVIARILSTVPAEPLTPRNNAQAPRLGPVGSSASLVDGDRGNGPPGLAPAAAGASGNQSATPDASASGTGSTTAGANIGTSTSWRSPNS